ncbi:hypothetical protein DM02DRAFT_660357 [Periconia macrospinosa]|uniref:Uncharacterized protein n=1 Tax=Periconia macrospinosa TaxID=97972 RepID=A0A2V1DCA5_9PLEO|nr:hypothetical protein DM02DRAFT_660357 [Periconia macrospinosa]
MLDQPQHPRWTDKKIQDEVRLNLWRRYRYFRTISANIDLFKKALMEIEDERAKGANTTQSKDHRPNRIAKVVLSQLQQSSGALSKKDKIETLLNDINRNNNTLYKRFHTHHTHLYNALTSACDKCACSEHRVDAGARPNSLFDDPSSDFKVAFYVYP